MELGVKTKNVGRAEAILRSIIGVILMVFAFSIEGISRWMAGLIGVIFILTAIFGFWPWKGFMLKVFSKKDDTKSWVTGRRYKTVFDPTGNVESPLDWWAPSAYLGSRLAAGVEDSTKKPSNRWDIYEDQMKKVSVGKKKGVNRIPFRMLSL